MTQEKGTIQFKNITFLLLILSIIYLVFEIAFNADLVRFLGGNPSPDDIHRIESWGRGLTGFAFALLVFGFGIGKTIQAGWRTEVIALVWIIVSLGIIGVVYVAIERMVEGITSATSAKQRQVATLAQYLTRNLQEGNLEIAGLSLSEEFRSSTEGHVFMGSLPFLLYVLPDLEKPAREVLRTLLVNEFEDEVGDKRAAFNKFYKKPTDAFVDEVWSGYVGIVDQYNDAIISREGKLETQWHGYVRDLARSRCRCTPERAARSRTLRRRVVEQARAKMPYLPSDWSPDDKVSFIDSAREFYDWRVLSEHNKALKRLFRRDVDIVPGSVMGKDDLSNRLEAAELWKTSMIERAPAEVRKYNVLQEILGVGLRYYPADGNKKIDQEVFKEFVNGVYDPLFQKKVDDVIKVFAQEASKFERGAERYDEGHKMMKTVIIIPIALFFSALGALMHIFKCGYLVARIVGIPKFISWSIVIAAVPSVIYLYSEQKLESLEGNLAYQHIEFSIGAASEEVGRRLYRAAGGDFGVGALQVEAASAQIGRRLFRATFNAEQHLCALGEHLHAVLPLKRFSVGPTGS